MKSYVRCAHCGKNPRSLPDHMRGDWKTLSLETYDPRLVNTRRRIQENHNEQAKTNVRRQKRMSVGGMCYNPPRKTLPRRRKSVVVNVTLFDDNELESEGSVGVSGNRDPDAGEGNMALSERVDSDDGGGEQYGTNRSRSGSITWCDDDNNVHLGQGKRRQSVWDRLTNVHMYPVNHLRRFDNNFDRGVGLHSESTVSSPEAAKI